MPTNVHPEYIGAEKKFYSAQTDEKKLEALGEMIKTAPSHKGAESLRKNLSTRYKKLREKLEKERIKARARGKSSVSIKKSEMQAVLLGLTNSGKSSILKALTNANPKIASYGFTTTQPEQGILDYGGCQIQIIDLPPIGSEHLDTSMINTADTILIIAEKIAEIQEIREIIKKPKARIIVAFNKTDLCDERTKRKIQETLKSKKYDFVLLSSKTGEGLKELKEKIFRSFGKIRVYTKQPNQKQPDREPVILPPNSTIKQAAEKIFHSYSKNIKRTRIWGPSSKFSGQQIGLRHILKDKDILEFQTK